MKLFISFSLLILPLLLCGQDLTKDEQHQIDSLSKIWLNNKLFPEKRVEALHQLTSLKRDSMMYYAQKQLNFSEKNKLDYWRGRALFRMAWIERQQKNFNKAYSLYDKAEMAFLKVDSITAVQQNKYNVARMYAEQKGYSAAIPKLKETIAYIKSTGYSSKKAKSNLGWALNNLGWALYLENDYQNAEEYFIPALDMFKQSEDVKGIRFATSNLLNIYRSDNNLHQKGIDLLDDLLLSSKTTNDTLEIQKKKLGFIYSSDNTNLLLKEAKYLYKIANSIHDTNYMYQGLLFQGASFSRFGNYDSAAFYFELCMDLSFKQKNTPKLLASFESYFKSLCSYLSIEEIARNTNSYLEKFESIENKEPLLMCYEKLISISSQNKSEIALDYAKKVVEIINNNDEIDPLIKGHLYCTLAYAYHYVHNNYDSVFHYNSMAKNIYEKHCNFINSGNKKTKCYNALRVIYNNIGEYYIHRNILDSAEYYTRKSLEYQNTSGHPYFNLAQIEMLKNNPNKAIVFNKKALLRNIIPQNIMEVRKLNYEAYKKIGKNKEALLNYEIYVRMKDSIQSFEKRDKLLREKYLHDYRRRTLTDSLNFQNEKKILSISHENKMKEEESKKKFLYLGLILTILLGGLSFMSYTRKRKDNKIIAKQKAEVEQQKEVVLAAHAQLEEKNTEIMDSIAYAKRIQSAILPPDKLVKKYLKQSFILYKPKDVVAGDFYWLESVPSSRHSALDAESPYKDEIAGQASNNELVLFAAADCTGHGVPGAMVSVICNNGLNRAVREYGLTDPGKILDKTREIVIQEFEKSEEEVKDGMDIAICSIDGDKLQYAGAHNPLWIIRNGEMLEIKANSSRQTITNYDGYSLLEVKADKQPIGQFDTPTPYTTHDFQLETGDAIYLFSDGYVDQFGGEKGKKFKSKAFKTLLLSIQDKSMQEQKTIIEETFETWKGTLEQIDDVCIIGVRI